MQQNSHTRRKKQKQLKVGGVILYEEEKQGAQVQDSMAVSAAEDIWNKLLKTICVKQETNFPVDTNDTFASHKSYIWYTTVRYSSVTN